MEHKYIYCIALLFPRRELFTNRNGASDDRRSAFRLFFSIYGQNMRDKVLLLWSCGRERAREKQKEEHRKETKCVDAFPEFPDVVN